jgi:hypothetical protein
MRGNGSAELGWAIVVIAVIAALLLPRLIRNGSNPHEHHANVVDERLRIPKTP